jgi:hypothetical protein
MPAAAIRIVKEGPSPAPSVLTLTLDTDDSLECIASFVHLCKNILGRCGPDEGPGAFVMFGKVLSYGGI